MIAFLNVSLLLLLNLPCRSNIVRGAIRIDAALAASLFVKAFLSHHQHIIRLIGQTRGIMPLFHKPISASRQHLHPSDAIFSFRKHYFHIIVRLATGLVELCSFCTNRLLLRKYLRSSEAFPLTASVHRPTDRWACKAILFRTNRLILRQHFRPLDAVFPLRKPFFSHHKHIIRLIGKTRRCMPLLHKTDYCFGSIFIRRKPFLSHHQPVVRLIN